MYSFFHGGQRVRVRERCGGPFRLCAGKIRNFLGLRTVSIRGEEKSFNYFEVELDGGKGTHRFADEELEQE